MIFILATDVVDATMFAVNPLGISLRSQNSQARAVCVPGVMPERFEPEDRVYSTPAFENAIGRRDRKMTLLKTLAIRRGATIIAAFDVPETLDRDSLEEWLNS